MTTANDKQVLYISKKNLDAIIQECNTKGKNSRFKRSAIYAANVIANANRIGYFSCRSKIAEAINKNKISEIVNFLISINIIDKSSNYTVGVKGQEYKIKNNDGELGVVNQSYFNHIAKKINRNLERDVQNIQNLVGIAYNGDIDAIKSSDKKLLEEITSGKWIKRWNHRKEGRLYTSLTSMSSEARSKLIGKNGHPLLSIDIKSCHPRLFHKVIIETYYSSDILQNKIHSVDIEIEAAKWRNFAKGDFYSAIGALTGNSRDYIKKSFLYYISDKKGHKYGTIKDVIKKEFPAISEAITICHDLEHSTMLEQGNPQKNTRNRYSIERTKYSLCLKLMKLESSIVTNICKSFRHQHKDENIACVFDCILIEPQHQADINELFQFYSNTLDIDIVTVIENIDIIYNKIEEEEEKKEKEEGKHIIVSNKPLLSVQTQKRNKITKIGSRKDGRYYCSINGKQLASKQGEKLDEFYSRAISKGANLA